MIRCLGIDKSLKTSEYATEVRKEKEGGGGCTNIFKLLTFLIENPKVCKVFNILRLVGSSSICLKLHDWHKI